MTVNCETKEMTLPLQAPESNQASVVANDSSAKTIEFLRARLLAERAASRAARQQAQEIAEKVKELNARLEMETKSRKEAESAMGKVFTILKAKGLDLDDLSSTDLIDQPEKGVLAVDDVKEMNDDPQGLAFRTINSSVSNKDSVPQSLQNKDDSAEKGMIEDEKHHTSETRARNLENGICTVCKADQAIETRCNMCKEQRAAAEDHRGQVQLAVTDKPMVYTNDMSPKCASNANKDSHTAEALDEGLSITLKLKAMLHQMEEEMAALPKEQQPLKLQLQSWVHHLAGVLNMDKNAGMTMDLGGCINAGDTCSLKEPEKDNAAALNKIHDIPLQIDDMKEEMGKTPTIVPKGVAQQTNGMPALSDCKQPYPSTVCPPPTRKDPTFLGKMFHSRRSSYDALHFSQQPSNMPMPPQMMQYGVPQPSIGHAPAFANGYAANGPPFYVEAQGRQTSDVYSLRDSASMVGFRQWCETQPQARGLGVQSQAEFRENPMKCRREIWSQAGFGSRDILSSPHIVDVSNDDHTKQARYLDTKNIQLQKGRSFSDRLYRDRVQNAAEFDNARPLKCFPASKATLSLTDDRSGRLGNILMELDTARQHINEEQSLNAEDRQFGLLTPTREEARLNRDCQYEDDTQQMPYKHLNHVHRSSAQSQVPIIQFPPSPASEQGYSPFERQSRHRKSSSVSANFMTSGWDGYQQPSGEVQLGNGITLYID